MPAFTRTRAMFSTMGPFFVAAEFKRSSASPFAPLDSARGDRDEAQTPGTVARVSSPAVVAGLARFLPRARVHYLSSLFCRLFLGFVAPSRGVPARSVAPRSRRCFGPRALSAVPIDVARHAKAFRGGRGMLAVPIDPPLGVWSTGAIWGLYIIGQSLM